MIKTGQNFKKYLEMMQNNKEQFKQEKSMYFKDCYCAKKNCDAGTFLPESVDPYHTGLQRQRNRDLLRY